MQVVVLAEAGAVEAQAPGEHHVGEPHESALAIAERGRRRLERREVVHAIVDHHRRPHVAQERQRHRRVEPRDAVVAEVARRELAGEQTLQPGHLRVIEARLRDRRMRAQHLDTREGLQPLHITAVRVVHRLLDEQHAVVLRESGMQVLGTLEHEVPAQVRKRDQAFHASRTSR